MVHKVLRVDSPNRKTLLDDASLRYIAVFKDPTSNHKKWGCSSPMKAQEHDPKSPKLPEHTSFVFIVPQINADTTADSKTKSAFDKTLEIINSSLSQDSDIFRFKDKSFNEEKLDKFIEEFKSNTGLELLDEMETLQRDNKQLLKKIAQLQSEHEKQKTASNNAPTLKEKELETQLNALKQRLTATQDAEKKLQREKESLEGQLHRANQKTGSGAQKLQEKTTALETSEKELERLKHAAATDQTTIGTLQKKVDAFPELQNELRNLRQTVSDNGALVKKLQQDETELRSKLSTTERQLKDSKKDFKFKSDALDKTSHSLRKKEDEVSRLSADIETQKKSHPQQLQQAQSDAQKKIKEQADELALAREEQKQQITEIEENKRKLETLKGTVKTDQVTIEALKNQVDAFPELQKKLSDSQQKSSENAALAQQLQQEKADLTSKVSTTEKTLEDTQKALDLKSETLDTTNRTLQAEQAKNSTLQHQLEEQTTTASGLQHEVGILVAEKGDAEQKLASKEAEIEALKGEKLHSQTTINHQKQQIAELQTLIATNRDKLTHLESQSEEWEKLGEKLKETEMARDISAIETSGLKTEMARSEEYISRLEQYIDSLETLPLVTTSAYPDPQVGELEFDADNSEEESDLDILLRQREELRLLLQQVEEKKLLHKKFEDTQQALDAEKENTHRLQEEKANLTLKTSAAESLLEATKADLRLRSVDFDQANHTLQEEQEKNHTLGEKLDVQTRMLEQRQDEVNQLKERNTQLSEQNDTTTQEFKENTEKLNQVTKQLDEEKIKYKSLTEEKSASDMRLDALQENYDALASKHQTLALKSTEQTEALNQLKISYETLQKQFHARETKTEQLEVQITALKQQNADLRQTHQQALRENQRDLQLAQAQSLEKDAEIKSQNKAHQEQLQQAQSDSQKKIDEVVSQKETVEKRLETSNSEIETLNSAVANDKKTIEELQEQVKQLPDLHEQLAVLQKKAEASDLALPKEYKKTHFSQAPLSSTMRDNLKKGETNMGETTSNERDERANFLPSSNPPGSDKTNPFIRGTDSTSSHSSYFSAENEGIELTPITPNATDSDSGHSSPTHSIPESPTTPLKETCTQLIKDIVKEKIATIGITNAHSPLIAADLDYLDEKSILDSIFSKIDSTNEGDLPPFEDTRLNKFVAANSSNDEDTIKAGLLSEFSTDINNAIGSEITQLQTDKNKEVQEILTLLTPAAIIERLHGIAQDAFKKELPESENSTTIPTHISEALSNDLNALLVADNRLETLKDQLQKQLESTSLSKLDMLLENKSVEDLLAIQDQQILRQSAEDIAKHHAEAHKTRCQTQAIISGLFTETVESTDVFKARLDNLGLNSKKLVVTLMGNPTNGTLLADLESKISPKLKLAKKLGQIIDVQKVTAIQAAIPTELLSQIDPAIETTLTTLEANQEKQGTIDNRLNKINPQAVLERLQKEAREVLDKQLSTAGGYQADETLLTRLNKSLLTLAQNHFATAKKRLGDNLASQTLESIRALNDDAVIDNLINTEFDQATPNKTLKTEACAVTEKLAKELIDRYKPKKPDDLEKIYLDSLMSIDRSLIGFAQAKKILTSRGLMLWIDKEAHALTQIERDITSKRLDKEQDVLQEKINSNSNLDEKEKASYKKSIQLIEAIKAKHTQITELLTTLSLTKTVLQVHIDVNDKDQNQALINIAMPAERQHAVIATDSYQALIDARNKANTTPANKDHALAVDKKYETYKNESFVEGQTLVVSTNITNQPDGKGHVVSIKMCKEDSRSKLYIDAIDNDDTYSSGSFFSRKTPIERYSNTADNISFMTQAMLENAQGTGNTPAEKGTGVLIINSHRPEWLNIYVELQVQKRLQPEQTFPFVQIEGPALDFLINDKKREQFKDKVEKLVEKRIKQLSVAESKMIDPLGIDSNNSRAALRSPG